MKVSTFEILAHHLAEDLPPGAVLLPVALVLDALELPVIVFDQRIERTGSRVTRLVKGSRLGLHTLPDCQAWQMSEKIERSEAGQLRHPRLSGRPFGQGGRRQDAGEKSFSRRLPARSTGIRSFSRWGRRNPAYLVTFTDGLPRAPNIRSLLRKSRATSSRRANAPMTRGRYRCSQAG
jgi:hypothetical protein